MPDMRAKKIMTTWMPQQKCLVVNLDKMAGLCERRSWEDEEVYQQEEGCQGSRQLEEDSGGGQDPQRVVAPSVVTAGYHGSNILDRSSRLRRTLQLELLEEYHIWEEIF
ncbi:uncharacterized protein LOC133521961 isoform X4 [Cydia pomonella]|uniref:uncharacterized protein LOC133521961 isoform X4 n=1 Tax=Cydia pomonella TaxID=82600 RepID=UPI002ADDCAE0|nr:uncharacterized protein LOC133521961 isoform X4 [Cydia pomonella]